LTAVLAITSETQIRPLAIGQPLVLSEGTTLRVLEYFPRAVAEVRPVSVPMNQRVKDVGERSSMARIGTSDGETKWLRFHDYAFDRPEDVLRGRLFQPTRIRLADGSEAEILFSRRRMPLRFHRRDVHHSRLHKSTSIWAARWKVGRAASGQCESTG
jgi:hypothetical protein